MSAPHHRIVAIDILRGAALGGMVLFHLQWDLHYWGWQDVGPTDSPGWMLFGHAVAVTFLFVSGFCLVLAQDGTRARAGGNEPDRPSGSTQTDDSSGWVGRSTDLDTMHRFASNGRWTFRLSRCTRGFTFLVRRRASSLRRIAVLAGMAVLISATTRVLFPEDFIFFGIIHCIAVSNLVGLAFLRAPPAITLLAGGFAAVTPRLAASTWFDGPAWWWLGLSSAVPSTLDYRPLLPWLAAVLIGIAAARLRRRPSRPDHDAARGPMSVSQHHASGRDWLAPIAWAGRHSLSIYVVHQPILFGLFSALWFMHPASQPVAQVAFERQCRAQCVAAGAGQVGCAAACLCVLQTIRPRVVTAPDAAPPSRSQLAAASAACLAAVSRP